jgi:hypothetical protein
MAMFNFSSKRTANAQLSAAMDDCVKLYFSDFPSAVLPCGRSLVNASLKDLLLQQTNFEKAENSLLSNALLLSKSYLGAFVRNMRDDEKQSLADALEIGDSSHPICAGIAGMIASAKRATDGMEGLVMYEVLGQLRGMTTEEIHNWWLKDGIDQATQKYLSSIHPAV